MTEQKEIICGICNYEAAVGVKGVTAMCDSCGDSYPTAFHKIPDSLHNRPSPPTPPIDRDMPEYVKVFVNKSRKLLSRTSNQVFYDLEKSIVWLADQLSARDIEIRKLNAELDMAIFSKNNLKHWKDELESQLNSAQEEAKLYQTRWEKEGERAERWREIATGTPPSVFPDDMSELGNIVLRLLSVENVEYIHGDVMAKILSCRMEDVFAEKERVRALAMQSSADATVKEGLVVQQQSEEDQRGVLVKEIFSTAITDCFKSSAEGK